MYKNIIMKKIYITAIGSLFLLNAIAQVKIDRTKQPKPAPAPVISFADPAINKLANGITVLVVEDHKLPKVTATYSIDYGPVTEGNKTGVVNIMGQMLSEGTTKMTKAEFDEAIDQMGAEVNLNAGGGSTAALTRYFDKAFMLMAEALRNPVLPKESFDKIKTQTLTELKSNEKNAKAISARVVSALTYGPNHPNGEFETEETINAIKLDDVKNAYKKYITPSRGYLTFVGDIKPEQAKALAQKAFADWKGASLSLPKLDLVNNPEKTEINFIDVPNVVQSEITVANLVDLPMSSPEYFAVLLANQILGGSADARLFMNLREKHGFTYGSYSSIGTGRFQTTFQATSSVRNEKVDSALTEILNEINQIRTEKVSAKELADAKALYNGNFALGLENPATTARFASNILINDLPKDFYRTYLQRINAVTLDNVQQAAQKYFNYNNTRIVVVGKAETVQQGLAKLGYNLKVYDKYAKPVAAAAKETVDIKVDADAIISKYITVIGGENELKNITSVAITGTMEAQGATLDVTEKRMAPNMELMDMNMGGQAIVHQVFDGKSGYQVQMGNKQDLPAEELAERKETKGLFQQMFYKDAGYKLEVAGIEKVGGNDAYKINITSPSGIKNTQYFDVATSYLVKTERSLTVNGQDIQQSIELSNYKKIGNVFFPFTNSLSIQTPMGAQDFTIQVKDIKVNEDVSVADFK